MKIDIFDYHTIKPLERFGFTHSFWSINTETIIYTWIAIGLLIGITLFVRILMHKKKLTPFLFFTEQAIEFFVNLSTESFGHFNYDYFAFITTLFFFTLFCNMSGLLPFVEEPTGDLNTALACGVTTFLYVQLQRIKVHGLWNYIKGYMQPIFILFPLNVIGECAKAASMSFRLFGNILGGGIILQIILQALIPYEIHFMVAATIIVPTVWIARKTIDLEKHATLNIVLLMLSGFAFFFAGALTFFGLFEAAVQAFVITMLATTYLSIGTQLEEPEPKEVS